MLFFINLKTLILLCINYLIINREKFDLMADEDLTLSKEAFRTLMKVSKEEAERVTTENIFSKYNN